MPMVFFVLIFLGLTLAGCSGSDARQHATVDAQRRVLVFTKTTDYRHDSIADGIALVQRLGAAEGFAVDASEDAAVFRDDTLRRYQSRCHESLMNVHQTRLGVDTLYSL